MVVLPLTINESTIVKSC